MYKKINESPSQAYYQSEKYICPDGDSVQILINFKEKTLTVYPFSGTKASFIYIDWLDIGWFTMGMSKSKTFEEQCFEISDDFCNRLGIEIYVSEFKNITENEK